MLPRGGTITTTFDAYYKNDCFLPLYCFCECWPLLALLRPSNIDACLGTVDALSKIVPRLRTAWPDVRIIVRGDSGFCRESIMRWCEENKVDEELFQQTQTASRLFKDFQYRTHKSWSKSRRVIGKAEHLSKGSNPRFVVTGEMISPTLGPTRT